MKQNKIKMKKIFNNEFEVGPSNYFYAQYS